MRHAEQPKLLDHVMATTIPMRGRMIHGRRPNGALYEQSQDYDVHGRVSTDPCPRAIDTDMGSSPSLPSTEAG